MPPQIPKIVLIHGNVETQVNESRYELERVLLPAGEADGEVVDIRPTPNTSLPKIVNEIIEELGTISLVPDMKRVVVVHQLNDFRKGKKGSVRQTRKTADPLEEACDRLEDYVKRVLPDMPNWLVFVYVEEDDWRKKVEKTSRLYQIVRQHGTVREFSEKRIDWQIDDALFARDIPQTISLLREWMDRPGSVSFRVVVTLNTFLQLLLQARLTMEAQREGVRAESFFPDDMRPSINKTPDFKVRKLKGLAGQIPLARIRAALGRLDQIQRSFFPTGEELVVHDAVEQLEVMLIELLSDEPMEVRR
ncbi:hypothetical protein KQI84_05495 [bacterium]|nr:hypothetical protein [bacterium]